MMLATVRGMTLRSITSSVILLSHHITSSLILNRINSLLNLSAEISQYSANEFARSNRYRAAFMTVCIPLRPQSNYYSLYLCPLRQRARNPCVLLPKNTSSSRKLKGHMHLFMFTPTATSFWERPVIRIKISKMQKCKKIKNKLFHS